VTVRAWIAVALLLVPAPARGQDALRVEISAPPDARDRVRGQLVDLPVRLADVDRPDATEDALVSGDAELCVFVRFGDGALRVGLIDRRASRWLVEQTRLDTSARSGAIETAALAARGWVRELLRGGSLGVSRPAAPEPEPEPEPEPVAVDPPDDRDPVLFSTGVGYQLAIDGSDEPSHGPVMMLTFGGVGWGVGPRVAIGLPQGWRVGGADLGRVRVDLALAAVLEARLDVLSFAGRARAGVVLELRETRAVDDGLSATEPQWTAIPTVGLDGGIGLVADDAVSVRLWIGLDAWLAPPRYAIDGGPAVEPWPAQPRAELSLRLTEAL